MEGHVIELEQGQMQGLDLIEAIAEEKDEEIHHLIFYKFINSTKNKKCEIF